MLKLQDYLDTHGIKQKKFYENLKISKCWFYKILRKGIRPSWELALKIQEHTKGEISLNDWIGETDHINKVDHKQQKRKKTHTNNSKF